MYSSTQAGAFALQAGERTLSIRAFTAYVTLAGLANATIASFILCRLPASQAPSFHSLAIRAVLYVACAVGAGFAGARFYWNRFSSPHHTRPPIYFLHFALTNAAAWVWVPAIVLLSRQDSPASAALSILGAALLANGLLHAMPFAADPLSAEGRILNSEVRQLFAETLRTNPLETYGYVIALCLYAAAYLLVRHSYLNADVLLALSAFLFAWKLTFVPIRGTDDADTGNRAALRFAPVAVAAVLATLFALLFGIGDRNRMEAARLALAQPSGLSRDSNRKPVAFHAGIPGYESIILWPPPETKQIVAPEPERTAPFATRIAKPLIIRFNGPYWYFQPPGERPGPAAYEAHGNPLNVNIEANNFIPLDMEAVQNLGAPIRLSRCSEVQVEVENRDNTAGRIEIGVVLTDSSSPGKPTLSLGHLPILSSEPDRFSFKLAPADEVLRFPVPSQAAIRKFDQITVVYFGGASHWQLGAKVAVNQFELLPR